MINLTGAIRIAGCAPQPCTALWSVSPNIFRSSTEWQYTASIFGHQSNADWTKTETIKKGKVLIWMSMCSGYYWSFIFYTFVRNFLRPCKHTLWYPKPSNNIFNLNHTPILKYNNEHVTNCLLHEHEHIDCLFSLIS